MCNHEWLLPVIIIPLNGKWSSDHARKFLLYLLNKSHDLVMLLYGACENNAFLLFRTIVTLPLWPPFEQGLGFDSPAKQHNPFTETFTIYHRVITQESSILTTLNKSLWNSNLTIWYLRRCQRPSARRAQYLTTTAQPWKVTTALKSGRVFTWMLGVRDRTRDVICDLFLKTPGPARESRGLEYFRTR